MRATAFSVDIGRDCSIVVEQHESGAVGVHLRRHGLLSHEDLPGLTRRQSLELAAAILALHGLPAYPKLDHAIRNWGAR